MGGIFSIYPRTGVWFGPGTEAIILFSPCMAFPFVMAIDNCPGANRSVIDHTNVLCEHIMRLKVY